MELWTGCTCACRHAHEVVIVFREKAWCFLMIYAGSDMLGGAIVDCRVGISMTFSFCIHTQGTTKRAAKITARKFSNVRS